jgi:PAP2 superfamily
MTSTVANAPSTITTVGLGNVVRFAFPHVGLWALVVALFGGNALYAAFSSHVSIDVEWFKLNLMCLGLAVAFVVLRCLRPLAFDWFLHRLWCCMIVAMLSLVISSNLVMFNQLTMTQHWPFADAWLIGMDRNLGIDWLSYAKFITQSDGMNSWLLLAYNGLTGNGTIMVLLLAVLSNQRLRVIETAFMIVATGLIATTIASFFPAKAAWVTLADPELLARFKATSGMSHVAPMLALRADAPVHIVMERLIGLATFPSYHTCLALIIMLSSRGYRYAWPIGVIFGVSIVAATPVYGGHYFIDLIAGAAVTGCTFLFWKRVMLPKLLPQLPGFGDAAYTLPERILNLRIPRPDAKRAA